MDPWSTACPDWERRIADGRSLVPSLPLFAEEAERAVRVFDRLRLPDVPGNPRLGDVCGDWFRDVVRALFGALDPQTMKRHISELFLLVPKKNAKTTLAAGVMVTAAIVNRRPRAEFRLVAPTKEIADIAYQQASGMVSAKLDVELGKVFHTRDHIKMIAHRGSGATLKVLAADTDVVTGGKPTGTLIDETHEFARKPRARNVFVELRGALAARPDGFLMQISTQSKEPPSGVFKDELVTAREVRDGRLAQPILPVIYELPHRLARDDGWTRPERLAMVNPNLGRSVSLDFLQREIAKLRTQGPEQMALFASQHANVEIGKGLRVDAWPAAKHWDARADASLTLARLLDVSEVVTAGVDGGGEDDLLGLTVLGRHAETRHWLSWSHAWATRKAVERRASESDRYQDFVAAGDLTICDEQTDVDAAADYIEACEQSGKLDRVGCDPAGIGDIPDAIVARQIDFKRIVGVSQQARVLMGAIKTIERKLPAGEMWHANQPLMGWCMDNARLEQKGNGVLITKAASGIGKIDPVMALLNAATLMLQDPMPRGWSYATTNGVVVF